MTRFASRLSTLDTDYNDLLNQPAARLQAEKTSRSGRLEQLLHAPARGERANPFASSGGAARAASTSALLSSLEFLAALSRLIPPPHVYRHRYHGVLPPNARLREHVVALGRDDGEVTLDAATNPGGDGTPHVAGASEIEHPASHPPDATQRTAACSRWARLLARIYEVFPLLCPDCGAEMRILAFITAAEPVETILRHLGLPATPPPLSPARGPPQHDLVFDAAHGLDIDQTPAYDLTEPEHAPDFDFDLSRGA